MINPGELALASIGVSALIDGPPPKMGQGRRDEAEAIGRDIPRRARELVADEAMKRTPTPRAHSYKALLDRFARKLDEPLLAAHETQALVDAFPAEASEMSGAFSMVAQAALEKLRTLFPMSEYRSFTGPKNLPPDDVKVWKFFNQLEVLNDPMRVFPLIATGALLKSQAQAVREVYPTLSQDIDAAIYAAIAKKGAETNGKYKLPPRAEMGVATWMGRRVVPYQPPKPAPPPGGAPAPSAAGSTNLPEAMATRNQAAIANQ